VDPMDSTSLPTTQGDREVYLRECGIEHFFEALKTAKSGSSARETIPYL
jgi:hypothetical protein